MHETPASAGWGPCTFLPGPARALGPAQTVRTERGPSIPHRLRAASRAADVGSHGYRLSLQTGRQGSEVAHGDAKMRRVSRKSVGCVAFRPGAGGGPDTGMAGEARARPLTPPMPHGEGSMVPLPREPAPGSAPAGPRSAILKNAEGTREPQKPWRVCESSTFPGAPRGPARRRTRSCDASRRGPRVPTLIEHRRNPRAAAILAFASRRRRKRTLSCGNVSWKSGAESWTFSGCGLTSAEAQPLSAPAVRPWTR